MTLPSAKEAVAALAAAAATVVVRVPAVAPAVLEAVAPEPAAAPEPVVPAVALLESAAPQVGGRVLVRAQALRGQPVALLLAAGPHRQDTVVEEAPRERQAAAARAVVPPQAEPAALAARRQPALPPTPPCRAPASWPHRRPILMAIPRLWAPAALVRAPEVAPGQQALLATMAANRDSPEQPASVLPAGPRSMSSGESISIRRGTRVPLIA